MSAPADLLAMVLALVTSRSTASASLRALAEPATRDDRTEAHRTAMLTAVAAICSPPRR